MTNAKTSVLNEIFLKMAFQCYSFALLLHKNCILFSANQTSENFSCISSTNQQISGKLVVFEKFPSVYEHQIALNGILLPIKIDDMYDRKKLKHRHKQQAYNKNLSIEKI